MDSGPEGPDGHRWAGGWRPQGSTGSITKTRKGRDGSLPAILRFKLLLSLCVHTSDPLNNNMCAFVCITLHKSVLMNMHAHATLCMCACFSSGWLHALVSCVPDEGVHPVIDLLSGKSVDFFFFNF